MIKHFIYKLVDKNQAVRYVGYTAKLEGRGGRREVHRRRHPTWLMVILSKHRIRNIALNRERYWIKRYWSEDEPLINVAEGGQPGSGLGRPRSYLTRARISASKIGKPRSVETRARMSAALKGKRRTPEAIAKSAAGHRGIKQKLTSEGRLARLKAMRGNKFSLGRQHTSEARAKLSAAKKGKSWTSAERAARTPEVTARISAGVKLARSSPEFRAKVSATLRAAYREGRRGPGVKGKPWSPARRATYERTRAKHNL